MTSPHPFWSSIHGLSAPRDHRCLQVIVTTIKRANKLKTVEIVALNTDVNETSLEVGSRLEDNGISSCLC